MGIGEDVPAHEAGDWYWMISKVHSNPSTSYDSLNAAGHSAEPTAHREEQRGSVIPAGRERKEFGVPLCVSRHFPVSLCPPDPLLWHGVPLDPFFGHPPGQVTPLFSPNKFSCVLMCPSGPTFTPPRCKSEIQGISHGSRQAWHCFPRQRGHTASPWTMGVPARSCQHPGSTTGSQPCP